MMKKTQWRSSAATLALAALAVVATAQPAAADPSGGVLQDDFDTLGDRWAQVAGVWEASDGAARVVTPGTSRGSALALLGTALDSTSSATVTFRAEGGGSAAWTGFTVHRDAADDDYTESGYTVLLRNSGELAVIEATGSGVEYLEVTSTAARPGTEWVTLTAELDGNALSVSIGGEAQPALTVTDDTFSGGGFSLAAHRDVRMIAEAVELDGVIDRDEPSPDDCIAWSGQQAAATERGAVLNSDARLAEVEQRVEAGIEPQASGYKRLMADVDAGMKRSPAPPKTYFVPFFYNDPDAHRGARDGLQNDANTAYQLALAYRLSGDTRYGKHAAEFIDAWMSTVACVRTSEDSALAFSYHFPAFVYAAELLRGTEAWSTEGETLFAGFLRETATPVASSIMHRTNNWGSWALALTTTSAAYLNDPAAITASNARAVELLDHQIDKNGHLPEEVTRNNGVGDYGIWYTHFSLQPLFLVAETLAAHGYDLHGHVNASGTGLRDAVEAAAGWVDDPTTFEYFNGDTAELANVRTVDYLRTAGVIAHSMSYFELAQNHYPSDRIAQVIADEGAMTSIHSIPHLSLTHGSLPEPVTEEPSLPTDPGEPGDPEVPTAPEKPTSAPSSVTEDALTGVTEGGVTVSSSAVQQGGTVKVQLPARHAGAWTAAWLFSEPLLLSGDWLRANGDAVLTVTVPPDTAVGEHRLAVFDTVNTLIGWVVLTVTPAVSSGSLATTGSADASGGIALALILITTGAFVVLMRRQFQTKSNDSKRDGGRMTLR
jgi:hypothetical protein